MSFYEGIEHGGADITCGMATLKWAEQQKVLDVNTGIRYFHPAGWALPGGGRVVNYVRASAICREMSLLMGAKK